MCSAVKNSETETSLVKLSGIAVQQNVVLLPAYAMPLLPGVFKTKLAILKTSLKMCL
jgi:hypothetical protein